MKALPSTGPQWSRTRWATWVLLAFVFQLGLIHALSLRRPIHTREGVPSTMTISRGGEASLATLRELLDPTLLSLGGPQGFQSIWMTTPAPKRVEVRWREEPAWLEVDRDQLGEEFRRYARTNVTALHGLVYKPAPRPSPWDAPLPVLPLRTASTFRVEGVLAGRPLAAGPDLRSWPAADVLTPSEVQVSVDHLGRVISAVLIPPGSGSLEADRFAVNQALTLRFAANARQPREQLALGRVVFDWHATPAPQGAAVPP